MNAQRTHVRLLKGLLLPLGAAGMMVAMTTPLRAEWPANVEAELRKIGQIVDPACTAKLYGR